VPSHDANQKIITKLRTWDVALEQLAPALGQSDQLPLIGSSVVPTAGSPMAK